MDVRLAQPLADAAPDVRLEPPAVVDAMAPGIAVLPDAGRWLPHGCSQGLAESKDVNPGWSALRVPEGAEAVPQADPVGVQPQAVQAAQAHLPFEPRFAVAPEFPCALSVPQPGAVPKEPAGAWAVGSRRLAGSLPQPAVLRSQGDRLP
jgi:hypothetical protein